MKTPKALPVALLAAGTLSILPAAAGSKSVAEIPLLPPPDPSEPWKWGISIDYMLRSVDRNENYWSPPELWNVDYDDYDANLWGGSIFVTPPNLGGTTFDFSYREGDMDGTFRNFSLDDDPLDSTTYIGRALFDREEYELGITVPLPNLPYFFGRFEAFRYDEDGVWDYGDGFLEPQEYEMWGAILGGGYGRTYPLGGNGVTLDFAAFLGLVYFDLEHKEVLSGAVTSWDGFGFKGSADARLNYPISNSQAVFAAVGYEYLVTDDGSLDMDTQGLLVSLGIRGEF